MIDQELSQDEKFKRNIYIPFPSRIARELQLLYPKFKVKNKSFMMDAVDFPQGQTSKRSAFVYGPAGTGKTFFACMMIIFCKKGTWGYLDHAVQFRSVPELLHRIKSLMKNNSKIKNQQTGLSPYDHEIHILCKSTYLILDDLGAEKNSEFTNEVLYHIVNQRYNDSKGIIVTSNKSAGELIDAGISSRMISRIQAMADKNLFHLTKQMRATEPPKAIKL